MWVALTAVAFGTVGYVIVVRHEAWYLLHSPWYARRLRGRAEAAVVANASG
jgi:hypothetical protein